MLSEVLYYFGDHDLAQVLDHAVASLEPDGTLLAVHWRHPVAEYPRTGDDVHRVLAAQTGLAEAAKQRKIMEKLRERQQERWQAEQSRKELALSDEVAMQMTFQNIATVEPEALR